MRTNQTHNNNNGKNSNTESKLQQKTQITQKYKSIHVLERRPMSFILDTDVPYACLFLTPVCSLRMSVPYACLFLTHVCSLRMSVPYACLLWNDCNDFSRKFGRTLVHLYLQSDVVIFNHDCSHVDIMHQLSFLFFVEVMKCVMQS